MDIDKLSEQWVEQSRKYTEAINNYVDKGMAEGWDAVGEEPQDAREPLASDVLNVVRKFNQEGRLEELRDMFPPSHGPFITFIEEGGQSLSSVHLLPDGRILARIGTAYQEGRVIEIDGLDIKNRPELLNFGSSPNRKFFAVAEKEGIKILEGWDGPEVAQFNWPTGLEGLPEKIKVSPLEQPMPITQLIPFSDGQSVLLVSSSGIFLLNKTKTLRLLPNLEQIEDIYEDEDIDDEEDEMSADSILNVDMGHGAVSYNGDYIAVGHQDSSHLIFDRQGKQLGDIGNLSEYPHYALFSCDDEMVALNSCHFYNGMTIGFPLKHLPETFIPPYELDPKCTELDDEARVYAGAYRNDEFIIGDAYGYLRAFDKNGNFKWRYHIGSTIDAIDISADGKTLAVTSYAGFLCILKLDTGEKDPFAISTTTHKEIRRWVFWKNEKTPLVW